MEHAGLLHDVGKVGVPTSIIRKPGRLDDSEMDAIRLHPARGVELIGNIPFLEEVKSAVLHHHEKYDGTGYPAGLSGANIPYFARIIGIVDAFDCLTSTRSYRPARSVEETLAILEQDQLHALRSRAGRRLRRGDPQGGLEGRRGRAAGTGRQRPGQHRP